MALSADQLAGEIDIQPQKLKDNGQSSADIPDPEQQDLGFILDEKDTEKVAKAVHEEREDQEPFMSRNRAVWKRNAWWREGRRYVRLEKKENQAIWEAKLPRGMGSAPPVPNKTDRLCRRVVNVIWVDPAFPECEPGDDTPEGREAAEFATRYLSVKGAPSDLNMEMICRAALDKSMTYASAFGWVIMDPQKGGHRPRRMLAHPMAQHEDDALTDPTTGGMAQEQTLKERFVRTDGYLSDEPTEADLQWLPSPRVRLLTGNKVNLLPATATHLRDAEGVIITDHTTLGELRGMFPDEMDALNPEALEDVCSWRPDKYKDILPAYSPDIKDQKDPGPDGKPIWKDSQTVFTLTVYKRATHEYPMGCFAIIAGKKQVLHRQKWTAMMQQPPGADGQEKPDNEVCLEIPLAQQRCLDDNNYDNPFGIGVAEHLGPADEIRASALGYQLEHMFRFGNPNPMFPMGTVVQPKQWLARTGDPIYFNPSGKPEIENVPPLPPTISELRGEMGEDMDDESGLQQAAQGVEDPSVKSGIHARTIVQEALKAISNIKSNAGFFYIDLNRIILEQARAFSTIPQMLSYVGKDGEYKEKEWERTSFRNSRVVTIARGSFTMHTLVAKQEMANEMMQNKAIDMDDYTELMAGGVSPVLGMQENPYLMRVRRQLDAYLEGPPDGWVEAIQASTQSQQMAAQVQDGNAQGQQAGQATGIPFQPEAPPPVSPPPPGPFSGDQLPIDDEPAAAKVRHRQLSRTMASSRFRGFPSEWQQELTTEYMKAKNSAGIMTVPETQKVQAQQQVDAKQAALEAKVVTTVKADAGNVAAVEEQVAKGAAAGAQGLTPDKPVVPTAAATPAGTAPPAGHHHKRIDLIRDPNTGAVTGANVVSHSLDTGQ